MRRMLQGKEKNWLHGQYNGNTGVAHYDSWNTGNTKHINPVTNWVVMCGTNDGSQLKLANGVDVGTATGGSGGVTLQVNQGKYSDQTSNFAIVEVAVWDRGLTNQEMHEASGYLMEKLQAPPAPVSDCAVAIVFLCYCSVARKATPLCGSRGSDHLLCHYLVNRL